MAKKRPRCKAKTKKGKRCRNAATIGDVCIAHAPRNVKDERGFGGPQPGSGRPRLPRPHEVLRQRIEDDIDRWLAPLEAALGASKPMQTWSASRGEHKIIYVADPELGMKATKLALQLVYGKPKQPLELTGDEGGPVKTEIDFTDPKVREALHGLVGAVADAREG